MLEWLAHWNNWPFLLSLLVGLGMVTMTVMGFSKDMDHGVDVDGDGIPDVVKPDLDQSNPIHLTLFAFLGVGKVPLSVLIEVLLVSFGLCGLMVNAMARDLLSDWGVLAFPVALLVAILGSVLATKATAGTITKFAPNEAVTARRAGEFVNETGLTMSLVTHHIGQVQVTLPEKNAPSPLLNVCVDPEWTGDLQRGTEVLLTSYDTTRHVYRVRPLITS